MINDFALKVSTAQDVTATAVSTNSIDLSSAASAGVPGSTVGDNPQGIGTGYPLSMVIEVPPACTAGSAALVTFEVITASDDALTTNIETIGSSDQYAIAGLVPGREPIAVAINPDIGNLQGHNQRYLGCRFSTTVSLTNGAFTVGFQLDFQNARIFPASPAP